MSESLEPGNFGDLLVSLMPRLRRFAIGLTSSTHEGDDLVQSACQRALERTEQWQPGTRLDSWMYRIMQTIWLDRLRAGSVRTSFLREQVEEPSFDGVRDAEARMTLGKVRQILREFPEQHRSVLLLVCVEGLSYREAAAVLDIPTGTVMSRLARARKALMDRLDGVAVPTAVEAEDDEDDKEAAHA
jgi:RNA polymerase sigma-70 factor, ECF subfamily